MCKIVEKNMTRHLIIVLAVLLVAGCGLQDQSDRPEAQPGMKAAFDWLAQVDAGNYTGTWQTSAAYFRAAVPQDQWISSLNAFRTPMGATVSRKVKSARLATTLPGAPDGQYVLIEYRSAFSNKKTAVETATVMLETGGVWRVSGYFMR
jgi:hypothetical protein